MRFFLISLICGITRCLAVAAPMSIITLKQSNHPLFGMHYPQGYSAVEYAYSSEGMWREITALTYTFNYYERWATPGHPFDRNSLIRFAADHQTTSRDANGILLADFNQDLQLDVTHGGAAFIEHNARGDGGVNRGAPFHQFWFDDNWLASYMSQAYAKPLPFGLYVPKIPVRWSPMGGQLNFALYPHPEKYSDQIILNGLHHLNQSHFADAMKHWQGILAYSQFIYDPKLRRFTYPGIKGVYPLGMLKVFVERILARVPLPAPERHAILQHARSLNRVILEHQVIDAKTRAFLGWKSGAFIGDGSLMNTENISTSVLGLSAEAAWVFEPGVAPWASPIGQNRYAYAMGIVSAYPGISAARTWMTYGPQARFPRGNYIAEFNLRQTSAGAAPAELVKLLIADRGTRLIEQSVSTQPDPSHPTNEWFTVRIPFQVIAPENIVAFPVYWDGNAGVDLGSLRILRAQ